MASRHVALGTLFSASGPIFSFSQLPFSHSQSFWFGGIDSTNGGSWFSSDMRDFLSFLRGSCDSTTEGTELLPRFASTWGLSRKRFWREWGGLIPVTSHNCLHTSERCFLSSSFHRRGQGVIAVVLLPLHCCLQGEMGCLTYLLAKG